MERPGATSSSQATAAPAAAVNAEVEGLGCQSSNRRTEDSNKPTRAGRAKRIRTARRIVARVRNRTQGRREKKPGGGRRDSLEAAGKYRAGAREDAMLTCKANEADNRQPGAGISGRQSGIAASPTASGVPSLQLAGGGLTSAGRDPSLFARILRPIKGLNTARRCKNRRLDCNDRGESVGKEWWERKNGGKFFGQRELSAVLLSPRPLSRRDGQGRGQGFSSPGIA
ncbi:hypothetical protein VTK73DRAFT_9968 [Phialemonium thermophilum]|uniref:Uncharacterized protein n=1 Tax=Phialemonium thermophilum TaxID=223376 RepID=A0ABR3VZ90_9PEZI